jgi:2,3-bisphosphoglycerate-independent phosphoglycerate mutase
MKATLEIENQGKRSGYTDARITNRIQEIEEIMSGIKDAIDDIETLVKENMKHKNILTKKHPGNSEHNKKTNPKNNRTRRG